MIPAIRIGPLSISTYWLMLVAGAVGMFICLRKRKDTFRLSVAQCVCFTCLLTIVGFTGAKLLFILENIEHTITHGLSLGGVSFFGSVFLIPMLMPLIGKGFRLKGGETMDICGPCVAVMIGCMRFGCFMQGCCGGVDATICGIHFQWPTQALESIGDFGLLFLLLHFESQKRYTGRLYPLFMLSYSAMRFLIEFMRDTPKDILFMSRGQWYALISILIGILWVMHFNRKNEKL